jgi:hypothetical protein
MLRKNLFKKPKVISLYLLILFIGSLNEASAQDLSRAANSIRNFATTTQQLPRERIFLHTDRDWYTPEDRIWFSAYVTAGSRNFLSDISHLLYVELIHPDGEIVSRELIDLDEGRGNGSIALNQQIQEGGIYRLKAYTKWSLNFGDSYVFTKRISIIDEEEWQADSREDEEFDIQFFPEGGHLVAGLKTNLAFKAINSNGYGINIDGKIIDHQENLVLGFRTEHLGMGSVEFTPETGVTYYALVDGKRFELPEVMNKGVVMNIAQNEKFLMTDLKASSDLSSTPFILMAHVRGTIYYASQASADTEGYAALIRKSELPTGIVHFTLVDAQGSPIAERIVFNQNPNEELDVNLSTGDKQISLREQVLANIGVYESNNEPIRATGSITIFDDSVHPYDDYGSNILTGILLESEIKGHIENPGFYFSDHENAAEYLDLLMMTQGWRAYDISDTLSQEKIENFYPAEKGISVSGKIKTLIRQRPVENAIAYITMNATEADLENNELPVIQTTDENGAFTVNNLDFSGGKIISAKGNDEDGSDRVQVLLDNQFTGMADSYSSIPQTESLISAPVSAGTATENESLTRRSITNQTTTEQFVNYQMEGELDEIVVTDQGMGRDWVATYFEDPSGATTRVEPNESEALRDLNIEQLLNQLPGVRYNFATNDISIREGRYRPLIFVDGVEADAETLRQMITTDIKSITVARSTVDLAIFGSDGAGGAIIVETHSGGGVQERVRGYDTKWFKGYQASTSFYSPRYGITVPRELDVQDQRITLHWDPSVDLSSSSSQVNFWTNDVPSTYRIVLQGITDSGIPFHKTTTFKVEP